MDQSIKDQNKKDNETAEQARRTIINNQDKFNKKTTSNFEAVNKKIQMQNAVTKEHKGLSDDIRKDHEALESLVTAFREQMKDFRQEVFSTVRGNREDLQD